MTVSNWSQTSQGQAFCLLPPTNPAPCPCGHHLQVPKLLMLKDVQAVQAYITDKERAWTIEGQFLKFNPKVVDNTVIPSERLIREALTYATEMERIV